MIKRKIFPRLCPCGKAVWVIKLGYLQKGLWGKGVGEKDWTWRNITHLDAEKWLSIYLYTHTHIYICQSTILGWKMLKTFLPDHWTFNVNAYK